VYDGLIFFFFSFFSRHQHKKKNTFVFLDDINNWFESFSLFVGHFYCHPALDRGFVGCVSPIEFDHG